MSSEFLEFFSFVYLIIPSSESSSYILLATDHCLLAARKSRTTGGFFFSPAPHVSKPVNTELECWIHC